jgi:hypothetical protein
MPIHDWTKTYAGVFHHFHFPLFLTPQLYVPLPLESTYRTAFAAMPAHLREELA